MGQGASRETATDQATAAAAAAAAAGQQSADHGSLLQDTTTMTNSRRRRRIGANRLSQLLLRPASDNDDDSDDTLRIRPAGHSAAAVPSRSGTLVRRTRSRFQEMLQRNSSSSSSSTPTSSRPGLLSHLHRSHYSRSRPRESDDDQDDFLEPPRLPSMDMSTTFDDDAAFGSHVEPVQSHAARSESSSRGPTRRLNAFRPDRPLRQLTSSLRRRRSPGPASSISSMRPSRSEDQAAMLSRLLSVAAAATAATLMGDDHNALREARSLTGSTGLGDSGGNEEDGSFDGFLRALQNGRIASALRQGSGDGDGESGTPAASLNFFRMFRFGASEPAEPALGENGQPAEHEGRMVPIIIVGIRSISPNSSSGTGSPSEDLPPFIDALGNFPSPLPAHAMGTHGHDSIDSILRPPQNGTSFRHRRRASMGGFGMGRSRLSDRMDDQRAPDRIERRRQRPWSVASSSSNTFEPRPPPATPASASPELSRISSRTSTPTHSRPTSLVANSMRDFDISRHNSVLHRSAASPLSAHTEETASMRSTHSGTGLLGDSEPIRLHRRSDTAPNIHYPRFSSGHPRRNGVVEPDNLPPLSRTASHGTDGTSEPRNSNSDSRSWIIYVLGGSYPENHPILTTPSLFTENPTYEDMMLLSALLGPAKAPVATADDVQSAGGVYNIETVTMSDDASKTASLVAAAVDGGEQVMLDADQRCLVCLCDFEIKDVARKLVKCNHLFHKECIDQWLTTGRNSCPLCRETGVDAAKNENENEEDASAPAVNISATDETAVGVQQEAAAVRIGS